MKKILIIAQHDFIVTVTRKSYILTLILMPLLFLAIPGFTYITNNVKERGGAIALLDQAHVVDLNQDQLLKETARAAADPTALAQEGAPAEFVPYNNLDQALADLKAKRVVAVYSIAADYPETGKITVYTPEGGLFLSITSPGETQLKRLLRANLVRDRSGTGSFDRVIEPAVLQEVKMSKDGELKEVRNRVQKALSFLGPFSMFILFSMAIFSSSNYLLQGAVEEKQNKVIEVLLSSVKPQELLAGKIIGLGAAGILQVLVYMALIFVPAMTVLSLLEVTTGKLLLALLYFILGYLLFASLMAATGIIGNSVHESSKLSMIWTLTSSIPLFLIQPITNNPDSVLTRALSYFPITAPLTMLLRISTSTATTLDYFISTATLITGTLLAIKGAAKVFRVTSLMYGKRPNLPEILRWVRSA
jgi:ABC-2 type transport system permease protein